ncbi:hypothetical protein [Tabrizicola sp.]|uniref:hypothetical protein n=1 Tax=Tabrizicola sp. TaxID=2005166 RepID=UPI003F355B17
MRLTRPDYSPYTIDVPGREIAPGTKQTQSGARTPERARRKGKTMRTSDFCFIVAGLAALTGMTMGIVMGIAQDFTLAPAHAHLNLLGWVTMALYGLYHRSVGRVGGWLGWSQVIAGAVGGLSLSGGLAIYLHSGDDRVAPLAIGGSLLAFLGMVLFVVIILVDLLGFRSPNAGSGASTA